MDFNLQDVADIPEEQDTEDTTWLAMRSVRGVAAHETILFPPRTVGVSNYIQLDAIINPWLVQKRLFPCSRLPRAALEV